MEKRHPDYREDNKMVVSNKYITAVHPDRMNINAMKLFRLAIAQCRMTDKGFYQYDFHVSALAEAFKIDKSGMYRNAQEMCKNLMQTVLLVGDGNPRHKWKYKHIFETCEYDPEEGMITVEFHEDMTDLFLQLRSRFTRIPIVAVLTMKSKYGIRLFELICMKIWSNFPYADNATEIQLTLDEIKKTAGVEKKKTYDSISHVKQKILMPALKEIEECAEWKITCTDVKHARKITGFSLEIWERNGWEVMEKCKREGVIPPRPKYANERWSEGVIPPQRKQADESDDVLPGQMSIFDVWKPEDMM